ncbi:MAG TPA: FAD-binding oxidoreductase, partial [Woeseiaceae bacterium]|nr:FAD-binding oxidoreductase [Woeseiaceae bacterium]
STALFLAERGVDVVVLEGKKVGWGASGRNGGQLIDGFVDIEKVEKRLGRDAADTAWRMGVECRDIVLERIERYSINCDVKFGYIDLALNRRDLDHFEAEIERKSRLGYPYPLTLVSREELPAYIGSERYIGGLVNRANGHLHPLNLCIGEALAAERNGARVFERSPVTRIRHGRQPIVETAAGLVRADTIVLAGNAYLGRVEPKLYGAVIPSGSYIVVTEPLGAERARELLPQDMAACDQKVGLDYFRLTSDHRLLFGGLCNYSGRHPKNISAALRPNMLEVFPQLEDARIEYEWGGHIAISLNRIPQIGRIGEKTYYAQGYSGHGLAPAHMAGKVLADAIGGDLERFDVFARIGHWKLPGGKWFANPALALGMLYYRLKELL